MGLKFLAAATLLLIATYIYVDVKPAGAQLEIVESYDVVSENAADGDIVSYTDQGLNLSQREYDDKVFGVIDTNPVVVYRRQDNTGTPIVRSGTIDVNVSTANGPIKTGDLITTSNLAGKGQKSTQSGYILGVALQDFGEQDGEAGTINLPQGGTQQVRVGKINIAIKIEFAELNTARSANRLLDAVNLAFFRNTQDPERFVNILRYILAGLAVIISFGIGFFTLARTIPKAMEALGRNPLARATIQFGIVLNIIFTVGIALVGVVAAIILLRF
jgi:F0F1-type ATP synthase membrane subunit c/vacuolar-type H+-ATPase subunit K